MKKFKPINFIGDEIYHEPEKESWWESVLAVLGLVGAIVVWTTFLIVIAK